MAATVDDNTRLSAEIARLNAETARLNAETARFGKLESDAESFKRDIGELKTDVEYIKRDIGGLKTDVEYIKRDLGGLKTEVKELRGDLRADFRWLLSLMIGGLVGLGGLLGGLMAKGFHWIT
jgi:chromosome segregation ATPase